MSAGRAAARVRAPGIARRVADVDWQAVHSHLDARGNALIPGLLTPSECAGLVSLYGDPRRFRSTVTMARHGFGEGEYRYFSYPLPAIVRELRQALYPRLVPLANEWHRLLGNAERFPGAHADFIARCHAGGQKRPTPLLLRYGSNDYNCLHQDLYGPHVFPVQAAFLLSSPVKDFSGGEFVLTEQRPRRQSRPEVVPQERGDAVIFAVHHRPVHGTRGVFRATLRHGVSRVRSGKRLTLGVIFHDAA